jgi:hypothetical protein
MDDPPPKLPELSRLFRDPDEFGGMDKSAIAAPAKERLDAPALTAPQVDDGLVMEDELVVVQSALEVARGECLFCDSKVSPPLGKIRAGEVLDDPRSR